MPRNKKVASRPKGKRRGGLSHNGRNSDLDIDFIPFAGTNPSSSVHDHRDAGFTLRSEAINTQRQHSWGADQKLRNSKVAFISAGELQQSKLEEPEAALADMSLEDNREGSTMLGSDLEFRNTQPLETDARSVKDFVIDLEGSKPASTGLPAPQIRSKSPTPSDSGDEVIVFAGRDRTGRGIRRTTPIKRQYADSYDAEIRIVEDKIQEQKALLATRTGTTNQPLFNPDSPISRFSAAKAVEDTEVLQDYQRLVSTHLAPSANRSLDKSPRRSRTRYSKLDQEQAMIDDYIANIEEQDLNQSRGYNLRDIGADNGSLWLESDSSSAVPKQSPNNWARLKICDFDDLSTSDDFIGSVREILSKRERESGVQYLVVWNGQSVDEARWVPHASLVDSAAAKLIDTFEAEEKLVVEFLDDDVESDVGSDDGTDKDTDDEDDELDLVQRKVDRMRDEKIARLLAKQEKLGLGSNELVLFDDSADGDNYDDDLSNEPNSLPGNRRKRGSKRPRGEYPGATALADAYDGFDVMDFERPSLHKRPKNRRGNIAFDLSDSDLEASLQVAFSNDRKKKKERKLEREELRAQGLLGRASGKPDLKVKYKEGMGLYAVKDEIKNFLLGGHTTLSLPSMDKADRKIVHELANAFNLKSKSAGKGNKRFPILYRTSRTSKFSDSVFTAVEARLTRRYLPRNDLNRSSRNQSRFGHGGSGNAAVSYRDGDVVGASAPELGVENKGRAMLEKMGWSTGTALGALNNKGILQPVSHVVKTTKAGLG